MNEGRGAWYIASTMASIDDDQDDEATLDRLAKKMFGQTVRQHTAPQGYECNVGNTFRVGEVRVDNGNAWVRPVHGSWVPLDHVEVIGTVRFLGDPNMYSTIVLGLPGRGALRLDLAEEHMTTAELRALFLKAAEYLKDAEKVHVTVTVDH